MDVYAELKSLNAKEATVTVYHFSTSLELVNAIATVLASDDETYHTFLSNLDAMISGWLKGQIARIKKNDMQMNLEEAMETISRYLRDDLEAKVKEADELRNEARKACLEYRKLFRADYGLIEGEISDQMLGLPRPPFAKPYPVEALLIDLPDPDRELLKKTNLFDCIVERESRRKFTGEALSLEELALLCFATQGLRGKTATGRWHFRTVPSGGARHPYETYLAIHNVEGLDSGLYRYLPLEHKLLPMFKVDEEELRKKMAYYAEGQEFAGQSAVVFIWSCVPYRTEWRYSTMARRDLLLEAGHICQNLYLAVEGLGLGTCSILAYRQDLDDYLGIDGIDEFVTYISPVGRPEK